MLNVLILNIVLFFHPLHVTMTTINQVPDSDTLTVFFRMYYDDFQLDYKQFNPDYKPGTNNDTTDFPREMLNKYFNERVQIYINNKLLTGELSDISIDSYEIRMLLKYGSVIKPRNLRVRNKVLTGIYSDQANMVYLNINNYEDAMKLTADKTEGSISLK
jgi:hypothetical protein